MKHDSLQGTGLNVTKSNTRNSSRVGVDATLIKYGYRTNEPRKEYDKETIKDCTHMVFILR
jgi:hypothetical protein